MERTGWWRWSAFLRTGVAALAPAFDRLTGGPPLNDVVFPCPGVVRGSRVPALSPSSILGRGPSRLQGERWAGSGATSTAFGAASGMPEITLHSRRRSRPTDAQ